MNDILLDDLARAMTDGALAALYAGQLQAGIGKTAEAERNLRKAVKLMGADRRPIEALKKLHGVKA